MSQSDARKAFERWDITAMHSILPKEDRWQAWQAARAEALREATSKIDNKAVATGTSAPAEQPTRHFSAKQIQDVFESYWSGTSSMSTKAAQFVADKLNTLLDAPAEQRLRELVGELQDLARDTEKSASGYGTFSSARAHLMDCKECLDALVKKYGERR